MLNEIQAISLAYQLLERVQFKLSDDQANYFRSIIDDENDPDDAIYCLLNLCLYNKWPIPAPLIDTIRTWGLAMAGDNELEYGRIAEISVEVSNSVLNKNLVNA
jgi:hypothetical protein